MHVCRSGLVRMVLSHVICSLENVTSTHEPGGFPGGSDRGDVASVPGLARSPGEGNGYPLQCSSLQNSMNRGAWRATVHGVKIIPQTHQSRVQPVGVASLGCPAPSPGDRVRPSLPAQVLGSLCGVWGRYCLHHWELWPPKPTQTWRPLPAACPCSAPHSRAAHHREP